MFSYERGTLVVQDESVCGVGASVFFFDGGDTPRWSLSLSLSFSLSCSLSLSSSHSLLPALRGRDAPGAQDTRGPSWGYRGTSPIRNTHPPGITIGPYATGGGGRMSEAPLYSQVNFGRLFWQTRPRFGHKLTRRMQRLQERCRNTPQKGLS